MPDSLQSGAERSSRQRLALGFAALAGVTYALIVLGALVRAHGAGLACPDWPLCFGEFVPSFDVRVAFEWGHRALAGSVSIGFATLLVLSLRRDDVRGEIFGMLVLSGALLAVQILLGALTVWKLLAAWSVTSHLLTGNAFAISLVFTAQRLHEIDAPLRAAPEAARGRALLVATAVVLLVQLVLGGLVASKYAGLACPDWPTCSGGEWFPGFEGALGLQIFHRLGAYATTALVATCAWQCRNVPRLGRLTRLALAVVVAQVVVGVLNVLWRLPVEITGLHSALAAALALLVALSVRESWRSPN